MQYLKKYPFTWALVVLIFVVCLMPVPQKEMPSVPNFDKLVHTAMYTVLCTVIFWERIRQSKRRPLRMSHCFVGAFVLPILMSGIIELLQAYATENRSGDWWDMAANSLGVILAWFSFISLKRHIVKK